MNGDVTPERYPGFYRVRRNLESADKVSIIIPTRDRLDLLKRCIDSIERITDYQNYAIVIINNHSEDPVTLDYLKSTKHRVIHDSSAAFNFARLNNQAAQVVDGKYLVFLNNDIDFCLRLRRAGYLIVFTPYALLYHKESASRGYRWNEAEVSYMMTKWRNEIFDDPFYSPNLTRETEDFAIDFSKPEAICRSHFDELPFEPIAELPEEIRTARKMLIHEKNFCGLAIDFGESRRVRKGSVRLRLR